MSTYTHKRFSPFVKPGSFLDHLQFCYEYSAAYFKQHSPRVLFLHSILGVGTNIFPMKKEDESTLSSMVRVCMSLTHRVHPCQDRARARTHTHTHTHAHTW
jgi:hypothetical protein